MKPRFLYRAYRARYRDQRLEILTALSCLKPGDVAVDVGAHKGAYLYWLRTAVGAQGKVFAFEPQPRLAQYLTAVCRAMNWLNVSVSHCAVSDSAGSRRLNVPGDKDSPGASLEQAILGAAPCHSYECRVDTLDHQLGHQDRVALIKVDVEGHELSVFRGATGVLSRSAPVLLVECEARHLSGHSMQDVFDYLAGFGYAGSFFSRQGLLPLGAFDPAVHQRRDGERFWDAPGYCNNFLFKHEG
jgi:FkbM family methyltransferase